MEENMEEKKIDWVEEKFGKPCKKCGLRKSTFSGTEGGRDSICKCDIIETNGKSRKTDKV